MKNIARCVILLIACFQFLGACTTTSGQIESNQIKKNKYNITLSDDRQSILISGQFDIGICRNVLKLYKSNKDTINSLIYRSYGGYLNESDCLFKLAKSRKLSTFAIRYCQSACTAAFLGGKRRFAAKYTEFGFHQFGYSGTFGVNAALASRLKVRQYNESRKFKKQNVSDYFVGQIFNASNSSMWFPNKTELLSSGFVHEYVSRKKFPLFEDTGVSL